MLNELMFRNNDGVTLNDLQRVAPAIFAEHAHPKKSERYAFIPTLDVVRALMKSGLRPVEVRAKRKLDPEDRGFAKHAVRFRLPPTTDLRQVGDIIPEITLTNSHDGGSAYQLMLAFFRLACLNGLTVAVGHLGFLSVKHVGRDTADQVVVHSRKLIREFPAAVLDVELMRKVRLEPGEQLAFARSAMALRWDPVERRETLVTRQGQHKPAVSQQSDHFRDAPVLPEAVLQARRFADEGADVWSTFNRVQENLVKGGLNGYNTAARKMRTKPIEGLDRDIKLNRSLWVLAKQLAAYKAGEPSKLAEMV